MLTTSDGRLVVVGQPEAPAHHHDRHSVMGAFSWNLVADLQEMWSLPFMLNAFRAGTIVAVLAAVVGWFMVLRRQSFAGHTLALVGFPGAAAAVWLGPERRRRLLRVRPRRRAGHRASRPARAGSPAQRGVRRHRHRPGVRARRRDAVRRLYGGFLSGTTALLFGSFLGITADQVTVLAVVAVGRAGRARRRSAGRCCSRPSTPTWPAPTAHRYACSASCSCCCSATTAAEVSQITGALLVFALLVLPPATAQALSARPAVSLAASVGIGLVTVWVSLFVAYYSPYPVGFWLTSIGFALYLGARASTAAFARGRDLAGRRRASAAVA